jgi:aminopeptidase N
MFASIRGGLLFRRALFASFLLVNVACFAQRLPQTVVPSHYNLSLDPVIAQQTFSGDETIDVTVRQPLSEIVMNSLDLNISEAQVTSGGNTQNATVTYDKPSEMVKLALPQKLPAGQARIHLKYSGALVDGLRGFYLSKTSRRKYAVTQFEGTYARMMFPCFDEPSFKATFDLSTTADKGDTAISNGRMVKDAPIGAGERHQIVFSTSPKMSTYLVALAIGDWQCLSRTVDDVPIRVCAVPEKKEYGAFALDVAAHSIQFYDQWYGIKYPFGKLDMLAIPDYEWGGMENTASIFYRDSSLLIDEKTASGLRKRGQSTIIAHEIAHQWFGDLVTAAWWDDIWLNEGFATWMERKPIEAWHPEWHLDYDAAAEAQQIIGTDSLSTARAIHGEPVTPSQIKEMFDGITYQKGGAVLRMLEAYLGPEVFRKGVNAYLHAHANGNATSADFWRAEAEASGKPVDKIMPTFVMQPGVPLVTVKTSCSGESTTLELAQRRFLVSGNANGAEAQRWQIPFCAKSDTGQNAACQILSSSSQQERVDGCASWVFGNAGATGYYRVQYAPENLKKLAAAAETSLSVPERLALVEDTWSMVRANNNSVTEFLDLATALRGERERLVIDALGGHLENIGRSLIPENQRGKYNAFVREQFAPLAREVGWQVHPGDTDEQKALRANLLAIMGDAGDPEAVALAKKLVDEYLVDPKSVDPSLAGEAFPIAAEHGGQELFSRLLEAAQVNDSGDVHNQALFALTDFRQPPLSAHALLRMVEGGKIRQQEFPRVFGSLLSNPVARDAAWNYMKSHWDDLGKKVTSFGGAGAVSALGNACTPEARDDIRNFFATHQAPGAERAVKQSLERIDSCIQFRTQQAHNATAWLAAHQ